ncbi:hypothetical protein LOTGIDRAFT_223145 [Lottia gigantea]|uniref:Endothelin-converting enzyme 1 n=1 Tax=Lottia gigantea TaxID=225164 RepID=V3ZQ36_LOTGI|nr:hypothetical protein LOTGIDRAFT_223145 [Lottia gigantea]ESO82986.1 hypothetical protein LOTGIDRAFT_223145 [Lottia gigantea]
MTDSKVEEGVMISPLRKLRSRIMADGYKYKMLKEMSFEEEQHGEGRLDRNSRNRRKNITCCYCFWFIILISVILLLLSMLLYQQYYTKGVCLTPQCVVNSAEIASKMNLTVDPCDDFYEYSCGTWLSEAVIPPDKSTYSMFVKITEANTQVIHKTLVEESELKSEAIDKARVYYKSCMNTNVIEDKGVEPIFKLIKELGSWTISSNEISGQWDRSKWDLTKILSIMASYYKTPLIGISPTRDNKDNTRYLLYFDQAGLTLDNRDEYFSNNTKLKEGYIEFFQEYVKLLGVKDNVTAKIEEIYNFEKKLAEIFTPKEKRIDVEKTYNKIKIKDLQNILNNEVNIIKILKDGMNVSVTSETEILVPFPDYFKNLTLLLQATDNETIANYLVWSFIQMFLGYLPNDFVRVGLILDSIELGINDVSPRWHRCVQKASQKFGFAVSALFVSERFSKESRAEVEEILNNIKEALIEDIEGSDWMDKETANKAIEKARAVKNMIGFPDWILQPERLNEYYQKVSMVENEFLENYLRLRKFSLQQDMEYLHKKPDPLEWDMFPSDVNAYYDASNNVIVFPAGILQPPFYDPDMPVSVKYGSVGMIIGHELTHGFDSQGRKYDVHGNLSNWWSEASAKKFQEKAKCMEDQYGNYDINETKLNGIYTLTENIADNGGLKLALSAYRISGIQEEIQLPGLKMDTLQQFFMGFVQPWCSKSRPQTYKMDIQTDSHSIKRFRVIGSVSNHPEFGKAFKCRKNAPMNPELKCSVW